MEEAPADMEAMDRGAAMKMLASVQMAREHCVAGRHGAATALFMQALKEFPELAEELETDLTFSLQAYGEHLASAGQPINALWLYSQAIPLLPRPRGMHTNLGALQYSLGKAAASIESFTRALELDPGYWPALESLENVKSLAVDRWHYRMLNHSARNEAYSRAIKRAVTAAKSSRGDSEPGVTVLDIGTGTGILAVMAARAGASHVYACEVNGVLCDIARDVFKRNGVADRVTVSNKSSGAIEAGVDLPERGVDVIVTELVDSGLLGERIIPVLTDARARGLLAPGGRVVPEGACVYAAVIESEPVRRRSRLLPGSPAGLSSATVCPVIEEPYTCEDLSRLEHRLLTRPTAVLEIDFLKDGAVLMGCAPSTPRSSHPHRPPVRLPVIGPGRADAVAVWFDLWLDGERGEHDIVSTRPEQRTKGDASGWDAGIYFASGTELHQGGEVALAAAAGRDRLHLTVNGEEGVVGSYSASRSSERAICDGGDAEGGANDRIGGPFLVGEMDLARLNDNAFHSAYATAVAEALLAQGDDTGLCISPSNTPPIPLVSAGAQSTPAAPKLADAPVSALLSDSPSTPPSPAYVLDLCGAWGVAGLLVAQLEGSDGAPATRVLALVEGEEAAAALNALAKENGLGPDRYVAAATGLVDLASRGGIFGGPNGRGLNLDDGDCLKSWGGTHPCPVPWSVVMATSLTEGSGLLKQGVLGDLEMCRRFICAADSDSDAENRASTTFVPGSLEVVCQGLQRASLLLENWVQSDSCCGVDVGPVNSFGVENFRELDLSAAAPSGSGEEKYRSGNNESQQVSPPSPELIERGHEDEAFLTAPVVCYDVDLADVRAGPDGCLQRRRSRLRVQRDGTLHALSYWFRQHLRPMGSRDAAVLDTGPHVTAGVSYDGESFRSSGIPSEGPSHFRQAAVLLSKPAAVTVGQYIDLSVFCHTSQGVIVQVVGISEAAGQELA